MERFRQQRGFTCPFSAFPKKKALCGHGPLLANNPIKHTAGEENPKQLKCPFKSTSSVSLTSCRLISFGLSVCIVPSRTSKVSLQSLLSRRLAAGTVAVETRVIVLDEPGFESVVERTRVFIMEEEEGGGGGGAALSV